jgi:hypothetical protein
MIRAAINIDSAEDAPRRVVLRGWHWHKCAYDLATIGLMAALIVIALLTFRDYAISNDEGVQHRYGELILSYYASG